MLLRGTDSLRAIYLARSDGLDETLKNTNILTAKRLVDVDAGSSSWGCVLKPSACNTHVNKST